MVPRRTRSFYFRENVRPTSFSKSACNNEGPTPLNTNSLVHTPRPQQRCRCRGEMPSSLTHRRKAGRYRCRSGCRTAEVPRPRTACFCRKRTHHFNQTCSNIPPSSLSFLISPRYLSETGLIIAVQLPNLVFAQSTTKW